MNKYPYIAFAFVIAISFFGMGIITGSTLADPEVIEVDVPHPFYTIHKQLVVETQVVNWPQDFKELPSHLEINCGGIIIASRSDTLIVTHNIPATAENWRWYVLNDDR